jgi:hypothetical protein
MAAMIEITPEQLAEARRLFEQTSMSLDEIAAAAGKSRATLSRRARAGNWQRYRAAAPDLACAPAPAAVALPHAEDAASNDPVSPQQRAQLAQRIQTVVERQMDAIERVLNAVTPADHGDAERSARTLASVSRALREVAALNRSDEAPPADETSDDSAPRDIDAFRDELARRIHAFIDARQATDSGSGDEAAFEPER